MSGCWLENRATPPQLLRQVEQYPLVLRFSREFVLAALSLMEVHNMVLLPSPSVSFSSFPRLETYLPSRSISCVWQIGCSVRLSDWTVLVQDKAHSCLSLVSLRTQLLFLVSDFDPMPSLSSETLSRYFIRPNGTQGVRIKREKNRKAN